MTIKSPVHRDANNNNYYYYCDRLSFFDRVKQECPISQLGEKKIWEFIDMRISIYIYIPITDCKKILF